MHIHKVTQKLYKLVGYGRLVSRPNKEYAIYEQMHDSKLRETGEVLKKGTIWIRESKDFDNKFRKL